MALLILSFIAGVLTVAAPCILPLLPVVVGGGLVGQAKQWYRPLVITASLAGSVIVFTLLLKATTTLLGVPQSVWSIISGLLVIALGLNLLFPKIWEKLATKLNLSAKSNSLFSKSLSKDGLQKDVLTGVALGPVFSSCSPTYALIVAVVLPESFARGFVYLLAYALGLASVLMLISVAGQSVVKKLGWLSNPEGLFKRVIGVLFILVGLAVLFGLDKKLQTYVLDNGWYNPIMQFEQRLNVE